MIFRMANNVAILISLVTAYAIEVSQLFHPEWLEQLRDYKILALILGFKFLWSDIFVYTISIFIAALLDRLLFKPIKSH